MKGIALVNGVFMGLVVLDLNGMINGIQWVLMGSTGLQ